MRLRSSLSLLPLALASMGLLLLLQLVSCQGPEATLFPDQGSTGTLTAGDAGRIDPRLLTDLFMALGAGDRPLPTGIEPLLSGEGQASRDDPNWPTLTYLVGEWHRQRRETELARTAFRELASWGSIPHPDGPYGDTWGGSGLSALGLWRWLQILDEQGPVGPGEVDKVLEVASQLQETRLYSGMVRAALLPALPLLEEDVARRLAHVAWKNEREEATSLFLDYLTINSSGELDAIDEEIKAEFLRRGLANPERLKLFRAMRMLGQVKTRAHKEQAAAILRDLWENRQAPPDVRAEAGYELANYQRSMRDRRLPLRILTGVLNLAPEGPVAQKALYRRGMVHNRGGRADDTAAFRADMHELIRRFPQGRLADDALFQLATEYLFRTEVDSAVAYFEKLQGFQGPHDYQDSAYYLPALGLIGRRREGDLTAADRLLEEYIKRYPEGIFRLRCLFWRGRIAEQRNDQERAGVLFKQVVDEAPYDYYGLRSRMHLEEGAGAIGKDIPAADSRTRGELHETYRSGRVSTRLTSNSPYHVRLRTATSTGLYQQLLEIDKGLTERVDEIPLKRLDARGLTPVVALLGALRQDALAAKDFDLTADNWLRLGGLLGHEVGDWPIALAMTLVRAETPRQRLTELHNDPRYLVTVYPGPAILKTLDDALARSAWLIDGSKSLSQSLMYTVIRAESHFYSGAVSLRGALGLFQFMPATFKSLRGHGLVPDIGGRSEVEYLLDPEKNILLWARWVDNEFPLKRRDGFAIARTLMKHQAGTANFNRWNNYWNKMGAEDDLEYRIETARFNATRNFVRRTLCDTAIVDGAGLFEGRSAPAPGIDRDSARDSQPLTLGERP